MVTSCKKGVIEDKQVKQLETHLISERKSSEVIGVNHLQIKKGGNWVKGNDKKGGHSGLEKSKKGGH